MGNMVQFAGNQETGNLLPTLKGQENGQNPVAETANNTPPVLTMDDIQKVVQTEVTKAFQTAQSMQSKMEDRIKKEMQARIDALTSAGIQVTETQKQQLEQQTRKQIVEVETSQASPIAPSQGVQPANDEGTLDPISQEAHRMMKEAGVELYTDDPEAAMVVHDQGIYRFLETTAAAIGAKKTRQSQNNNPLSRMPAGSGPQKPGNLIANVNDIDTLYSMANKRR